MALHAEEILENIVQLGELWDEKALAHLSDLPLLELAKRKLEVMTKRSFCPLKRREVDVDFFVLVGQPECLLGVQYCSILAEEETLCCNVFASICRRSYVS